MSAEAISRRMPRPRKITLGIILGMAFTNSVLLVVTLVRPVPQFSSSGTLMTISARGNATLGKRGLAGSPDEDESADEIISTITPSPWKPERRKVRNEDEEGWYIADEESNETSMNNEEENPATTSENSKTSDSEDFYFPESTSSSARNSRATNEHSMSTLPPKQTMTVPKKKQDKIVKVKSRPFNDGWVELWIGPLGVCIQRGNGTIACSTASLMKNFLATYKQAGLNDEIIARLPHHLEGCPVALLLAAVTYTVCTGIFAITLSPPFSLLMRYGPTKSMDARHQTSLALNTVLATAAIFLTLSPTFILRNMFLKSLDSIPAFDSNLIANLGGAFAQLYACSILGALILLQSMVLVSEDLRKPWWFVYNTLRRNPFQTNTRGIDFTAHRQIKRQAEAQARAEAEARALAEAVGHQFGPESAYDEHDGLSRYAPTGIGASEIAPPGGSVFIPNRRSSRLHRTGTTSHYNDAFPPRRMTQPYGASRAGSVNYPAMYRRDSGSVIPDMSIHSRPRSPEFPAKGW